MREIVVVGREGLFISWSLGNDFTFTAFISRLVALANDVTCCFCLSGYCKGEMVHLYHHYFCVCRVRLAKFVFERGKLIAAAHLIIYTIQSLKLNTGKLRMRSCVLKGYSPKLERWSLIEFLTSTDDPKVVVEEFGDVCVRRSLEMEAQGRWRGLNRLSLVPSALALYLSLELLSGESVTQSARFNPFRVRYSASLWCSVI